MNKTIHSKVLEYIDKYRVVSLSNLVNHFHYLSKKDIIGITMMLYKHGQITYYVPKNDGHASKTLYFSETFNPAKSTVVFENDVVAITRCLTVLDAFRKKFSENFKITYDALSFYPTVVKFGIVKKGSNEESRNLQLVFVPYSENNDMAKYIGKFYDKAYDDKYDIVRYAVVEYPGMLKGKSPQQIYDNIPRVKGFAICNQSLMTADIYSPEELGVVVNE